MEVNTSSWEIVGEQLGESWETASVDIWDISIYARKNSQTRGKAAWRQITCVKIPKPEVLFTETHTRKNFETSLLFCGSHIKIPKPDLHKNYETTPVKNPETRGGKIYNLFIKTHWQLTLTDLRYL